MRQPKPNPGEISWEECEAAARSPETPEDRLRATKLQIAYDKMLDRQAEEGDEDG